MEVIMHIRTIPLFALSILIAGCSRLPPEVPYQGTVRPGPFDWETLFATPADVEVIPLLTGEVQVDYSLLLDLEHPTVADVEDKKVWVPVLSYLVRHPVQGEILIDTGFDSSFAESGHGNFGGLAHLVEFARQTPGNDTVGLLEQLRVNPASLSMVIVSHMHSDHTAGLPELPAGIRVVSGLHAIDGYESPLYADNDHLEAVDEIETLDFADVPMDVPGPTIDLFGDGSVFLISSPGHAAGNLSILVNGSGGPLLLTGDASHTRKGFESGVAPGKVTDRVAAEGSLARLREFSSRFPQVRVKFGHEASDWDMARGIQETL
jgi:glyoxylase-like metal-dependent hydrolase (beta-lactamase superfamily II)